MVSVNKEKLENKVWQLAPVYRGAPIIIIITAPDGDNI